VRRSPPSVSEITMPANARHRTGCTSGGRDVRRPSVVQLSWRPYYHTTCNWTKPILPPIVNEPTAADLDNLPPKLRDHQSFFERLLREVRPTPLTQEHQHFVRSMGITGDAAAAYRRMALRDEQSGRGPKLLLPDALVYRHPPAFAISPSSGLMGELLQITREMMQIRNDPIVLLDSMAGGGAIPLEAVRYGFKVYANELNTVANLILKATLEYPTRFGRRLRDYLGGSAQEINEVVCHRLSRFFPAEPEAVWWSTVDRRDIDKLRSRQVVKLQPGGDAVTRDYLWLRTVQCPRCDLNISLSTNFLIVSKKGKPEVSIAALPVVPTRSEANGCTFRIVPRAEWQDCVWPRPGFETWDPRGTPTFNDGKAICPRCG
jgi:putative DNA methylase